MTVKSNVWSDIWIKTMKTLGKKKWILIISILKIYILTKICSSI